MTFQLVESTINNEGVRSYLLNIPDVERIYFGYILESLEGWCYYTGFGKNNSLMRVDVMPAFINDFETLLTKLQVWEPFLQYVNRS